MKAKYSPISQRIAVAAPKPTISQKTSQRRSITWARPTATAPVRIAQLTKWLASSHQSLVSDTLKVSDTVWTDPQWLAGALAWLEAQGVELTGAVEQPHVRPWSTA